MVLIALSVSGKKETAAAARALPGGGGGINDEKV
jgi:hypothetical protein